MTIVFKKSFEDCLYSWTCIHIISAEAKCFIGFLLLLRNFGSSSYILITLTQSLLPLDIKCFLVMDFCTVFTVDHHVDLVGVSFASIRVPLALIGSGVSPYGTILLTAYLTPAIEMGKAALDLFP